MSAAQPAVSAAGLAAAASSAAAVAASSAAAAASRDSPSSAAAEAAFAALELSPLPITGVTGIQPRDKSFIPISPDMRSKIFKGLLEAPPSHKQVREAILKNLDCQHYQVVSDMTNRPRITLEDTTLVYDLPVRQAPNGASSLASAPVRSAFATESTDPDVSAEYNKGFKEESTKIYFRELPTNLERERRLDNIIKDITSLNDAQKRELKIMIMGNPEFGFGSNSLLGGAQRKGNKKASKKASKKRSMKGGAKKSSKKASKKSSKKASKKPSKKQSKKRSIKGGAKKSSKKASKKSSKKRSMKGGAKKASKKASKKQSKKASKKQSKKSSKKHSKKPSKKRSKSHSKKH